ncbi:MAG: Nif3-like dinuclear metal center hexameric protein [Armatimonadaceae bacterium]
MAKKIYTVGDICNTLETIAPSYLALENDPTGLLVGDWDATVQKVLVALDVTMAVVERAAETGAGMIIAHHPLIYHPLRAVRVDEPHPGRVVYEAIRAGIAVACAHTCWDVAPGGVNDVLAGLLGLEKVRPLKITCREPLVKIAVFVPVEHREAVLNAMAEAGAGAIGEYDRCAFWTSGTGTFRPLPGANPFVGTVGEPEQVAEERLEMIVPETRWRGVVQAMKAAHPYEEVAFDVFPLQNTEQEYGIGRIGELPEPVMAEEFLGRVQKALSFDAVRMAGPVDRTLRRVAVCGGAGANLLPQALASGADALVTSDVRHHEFVDAAERGFVLIDAGHAATETPGSRELANRLAGALPKVPVEFI